jgi:two-component system response regulator DevR
MPQPCRPQQTVLVADANPLIRAGLCAILRRDRRFRVVDAAVGDPSALLPELQPDLLVIDPAGAGGALIRRAVAAAPACSVCVYTDSATPHDIIEAIVAGAGGYLLKQQTDPATLGDALEFIGRGHAVLVEPSLVACLRDHFPYLPRPSPGSLIALPAREHAILRELVTGASDKQIATRLDIACSTVRTHVARLRLKFTADTRSQLVARAIAAGALSGLHPSP